MTPDDARKLVELGRRDPVWWIESATQCELWSKQREIVRSVFEKPGSRVAVKACNSAGKTHMAARIVLAFFYLFPGCKILTTAPSFTAVSRLLWGELAKAHSKLPVGMGGTLYETELRASRDWWALGLSTDTEERFKGHHAPAMLVVVDEAPGLRPAIWKAIETIRAGGDVRTLVLGNPTIPTGYFREIFTAQRESWSTHTISALETPNLVGLGDTAEERLARLLDMTPEELAANPHPSITTRQWVLDQYRTLGPRSPLWQSNVLGEFPDQAEDSLFPLAWLEAARNREPSGRPGWKWYAGLDVAGPGEDLTVLTIRQGPRVVEVYEWADPDPRGAVLAKLEHFRPRGLTVHVDSIGIGYYFAQHIRDAGYDVIEVNVGEAPADRERFANLKAEAYWGLRMRFESGDIGGRLSEGMLSELASIQYEHNARGQVVIESKEAMRKRGVKSPDRAESLMLCFADTPAMAGPAGSLFL